jgi:excisionase family DNA binding protein
VANSLVVADPAETPTLVLRPREAAKALGVCPRTLATWTKAGKIPVVRVGSGRKSAVLYPVEVLRAWLAEQAAAQQPAK